MFLLHANITRYFYFLITMGNLTLVFHKGVNSIRADNRQHLFPQDACYFLVTNGNLPLLFSLISTLAYLTRVSLLKLSKVKL